jgi:hypothetical protein
MMGGKDKARVGRTLFWGDFIMGSVWVEELVVVLLRSLLEVCHRGH